MSRLKHTRIASLSLIIVPVAFAAAAIAQTASDTQMMASYICRPALTGETASAKMLVPSTSLVCKPFAVDLSMSDGSMKTIGNVSVKTPAGPDFGHALTVQQANAAYNSWVQKTFHIDPAREHTN